MPKDEGGSSSPAAGSSEASGLSSLGRASARDPGGRDGGSGGSPAPSSQAASGAVAVPRGDLPRNFSVEFFPDSYDGGAGLLTSAHEEEGGDAASSQHDQQLRVLRVQKIQEEFRLSRMYTDMLFLCRAGNVKTLRTFCKAKQVAVSDPAVCDYDKRTPLHLAAAEGNYAVADWLLQEQAPVNCVDRFHRTPLEDAIQHGHMEIARRVEDAGGKVFDSGTGRLVDFGESNLVATFGIDRLVSLLNMNLDWEISPKDLVVHRKKKIGQGTFGEVVHGRWRGTHVAVKVLKKMDLTNETSVRELRTELAVCKTAHHPNVVQFLGAVTAQEPCMIVTELMKGSVAETFRECMLNPNRPLTMRKAEEICLDICRGMAYLHGHRPRAIIHRDLKPENLLFTVSEKVKVGDFGLSKTLSAKLNAPYRTGSMDNVDAHNVDSAVHNEPYKMTGETGSYRYMAPEVYKHEAYGPKVDVYAFAMIAYQAFTNLQPFMDKEGILAARAAAQGSRPKFPKNCVPEPIREIIRNCWHSDFRQRPTFEAVIERLEPLVERLPRRSRKGEGPCAQQ